MGRFARTKRIARIVCMNELNNHYRMLLGLDEAWPVKSVDLSMESKRVVISLVFWLPASGIYGLIANEI